MSGEGVSVIITVNNMADYIRENLKYFFDQKYDCFEIVIVDECSEDDTQEVLAEMQAVYPNLRTTRIFPGAKFRNTKKLAINLGVLASRYDIILFTEISCRPASCNWIKIMAEHFNEQITVALGYANYDTKRRVDIPKMYRFLHFLELFFLTKAGCYVVGEGFNMGWRKKQYLQQNVFYKNSQSYSGYDNAVVKALSKQGAVRVVKDPDATVLPNLDTKKKRKEKMAYYYYNKRKWPLGAMFYSAYHFGLRWMIYILGGYMLFRRVCPEYNAAFIAAVFLIDVIILNICLGDLKQKKLLLASFVVCSIGFLYRWYHSIYSIFTYKKWR